MKKILLGILISLLLSACVPTTVIPKLEAAEKVIEGEIDATLGFAVRRLCQLKVDIISRAMEDADMARAIYYACPDVRSMVFKMARAVGPKEFQTDILMEMIE